MSQHTREPDGSPPDDAAGSVYELGAFGLGDVATAGRKAANLSALAREGFPVPPGVVVPATAADAEIEAVVAAALEVLGDGPLAVRSSAIAEDLEGASFAGQYETVLDVRGTAGIVDAVRHVRQAANDDRVAAYRSARGPADADGMAVVLQTMIAADASGVAFTAHPLTGVRQQTVVTATIGMGEQLVGGEATGEQWVVTDGHAVRDRRAAVVVLDERMALAVAELARRVERFFDGVPQDIEWAFRDGELYLLQARPMTALPEPVRWEAPRHGATRNFRFGEWLPDPITPLSATWLIPALEERLAKAARATMGVEPQPPQHVLVNGWYYYMPLGSGSVWGMLGLLRRPRFVLATALSKSRPEVFHRLVGAPQTAAWRDDLLPRYRELVDRHSRAVETADDVALARMLDDIAGIAGEYMNSMTVVAGSAWKVESVLAAFYARHLRPTLGGSHQTLVAGLSAPRPTEPHAVQSIDWVSPTAGELGLTESPRARDHRTIVVDRERAEQQCRDALPEQLRSRFESLLALSQLYARLREEQVSQFTLGWPLARRAVHRLGESCVRRGVIDHVDDIYFLARDEIELGEPRASSVAERRELWARNRMLCPPLVIGNLPKAVAKFHGDAVEKMRAPGPRQDGMLEGMPASPGRATGVARVLTDLAEADRLGTGEILVTAATTPAWTPLFGRAAAIATDGGSLVAHASLVAREYGIPAVVALGDAMLRIRDGQTITVDGSTGTLEIHD